MASEWFVRAGNQAEGPFSPSHLKQLAQQGRVTSATKVRRGTDGQWILAGQVQGLIDHAAVQPAGPAPSRPTEPPPLPAKSNPVESRPASEAPRPPHTILGQPIKRAVVVGLAAVTCTVAVAIAMRGSNAPADVSGGANGSRSAVVSAPAGNPQTEHADDQSTIEALKAENRDLRGQIAKLSSQPSSDQSTVDALRTENRNLRAQIATLSATPATDQANADARGGPPNTPAAEPVVKKPAPALDPNGPIPQNVKVRYAGWNSVKQAHTIPTDCFLELYDDLRIGDVGEFRGGMTCVDKIISSDEMCVRCIDLNSSGFDAFRGHGHRYIVSGVPTADYATGSRPDDLHTRPFVVARTDKLDGDTLFVLVPVDKATFDEFIAKCWERLEKERQAKKKRRPN